MDTINDGTLFMLGFRRPQGRWFRADDRSCWLNENPVNRTWSVLTENTTHYSGIKTRNDLIDKYLLVTGVDLRDR